MTRKRFVKLLMADGYSRNDANSIARDTSAEGWTYSLKYYFLQAVNSFPEITVMPTRTIVKMVDLIVETLPSMIQAIIDLAQASVDAVQSIKALEKELEV